MPRRLNDTEALTRKPAPWPTACPDASGFRNTSGQTYGLMDTADQVPKAGPEHSLRSAVAHLGRAPRVRGMEK